MKDIIIENGDESIILWASSNLKFIFIDNDGDRIRVLPESIDELIKALQQIKKEINHV